jgi:hypothetical protein
MKLRIMQYGDETEDNTVWCMKLRIMQYADETEDNTVW